MSRTHVHAPYWVQQNRNQQQNEDFYHWHNHLNFGKPIYMMKPKKDANGRPIIETSETLIHSSTIEWVKERYGEAELEARVQKGSWRKETSYNPWLRRYIDRYYNIHKYKATERVIVGYYADYCTIGEWRDEHGKMENGFYAPCTSSVSWRNNIFAHPKARREAQRTHRRGLRNKNKTRLTQVKKNYNSNGSVEDNLYNWESMHKMENQTWWD